jgi:cytochrome P450
MALPCEYGDAAYRRDPYAFFGKVHDGDGVYKVPSRNDYLVTRHADLVYVAEHPELFSNEMPSMTEFEFEGMAQPMLRAVPKYDPPLHTSIRDVAARGFTAEYLRSYEPLVRSVIDDLIDNFAGRGSCEFVSEFAYPLPMRVICRLLGFPIERYHDYRRWSDALAVMQDGYFIDMTEDEIYDVKHSVVELQGFLDDYIRERIANRGDDMVSAFISAQEEAGISLEQPQLMGIAQSLFSAGNETTAHMLGNLMNVLMTNPDELRAIEANPSNSRRLIEECLRADSPVHWLPRTCLRDTEISGVPIPAGARLLLMFGAANRDACVFEQPAKFDKSRPNLGEHLAFGYGAHFCLGAPLARREGRMALEALFARLRNITLDPSAPAPKFVESVVFRHLERLDLTFDVREGSARP